MTLDVSRTSDVGAAHVSRHALLALAVPAALGTLLVAAFICVETFGGTLSTIRITNVSEAAGLGLGAETLRRVRRGEDPTRVQHVRPEIISSAFTEVTALEAAVFGRKVELVRMLDHYGFVTGDQARRGLACLARDQEVRDVAQYLIRPGDPPCEPGAARSLIASRTR